MKNEWFMLRIQKVVRAVISYLLVVISLFLIILIISLW
jgi:hypothetical protein